MTWPTEQKKANVQLNGMAKSEPFQIGQLFAQSNGQLIEVSSERVAIKSVWEYFIEKE